MSLLPGKGNFPFSPVFPSTTTHLVCPPHLTNKYRYKKITHFLPQFETFDERQFLDTQVSLEPTPKLVGWSVSKSHFRIYNLWSVTVDQIKKIQKNKVHLFSNFASGRTLPTHENVYEDLNAQKCI